MQREYGFQNESRVNISFRSLVGCYIGVVSNRGEDCDDRILDVMYGKDFWEPYYDQDLSDSVEFNLNVTKAGKTIEMFYSPQEGRHGSFVDGITVLEYGVHEDFDEDIHLLPEEMKKWPENVKKDFEDYVMNECKVDEDVLSFVAMYSNYLNDIEWEEVDYRTNKYERYLETKNYLRQTSE